MGQLNAAWREFFLQFRLFWRKGTDVSLTLFLPLTSLIFVQALNARARVPAPDVNLGAIGTLGLSLRRPGMLVSFAPYGTAGMAALGLAAASFVNLMISIATARERGTLKRIRGTPISPLAYLAGQVSAHVAVGILITIGIICFAAVRYGVEVQVQQLPVLALCAIVGASVYTVLGIAAAKLVFTAEAAHATAYGFLIPVMLTSSIFHAPQIAPERMRMIGEWLPLQPLAHAIFAALVSPARVSTIQWDDLAKLVAWGLIGGVIALQTFRWMPTQE